MTIQVRGMSETMAALNKFAPDLLKETNKEMVGALKEVVSVARGFVPKSPLSGWTALSQTNTRKISAKTSMFQKTNTRSFPQFNEGEIRAGLSYSTGHQQLGRTGYVGFWFINNNSPAGAIYETAGRKNPNGADWRGSKASPGNHDVSHSNNPRAGKQFIEAIDVGSGFRKLHKGKRDGRLAFRALEENEAKLRLAVEHAVATAVTRFKARTDAFQAFGGVL